MSTHTYKKFEDVESGALPDKMTIFQDCIRAFNASPVDAKKCRLLIGRLLRLIYNGDKFPTEESTSLFFSVSKLFQHKDSSLRQIVYLAIKELSTNSNDILMVTSSIMKDVQNGDIVYKSNAIRTLVRVLDGSTIHSAERLMKSAIVDKHPSVSSAAIVSSYHLLPVAKEVIKRWSNETQESVLAIKSYPQSQESSYINDSLITQYHALGLLYSLRNHDKMALRKFIQQFSTNLRNPIAICQLIRYINEILINDLTLLPSLLPLLESWINDRHHSINLEAIKVIISLPISNEVYFAAILRLKYLLGVSSTVTRFAAVRILNKISIKSPEKIVTCNDELESLINDSNRSIATYAITTLLKTGTSDNIERLIKTISKFINEISDEFKIIIIDSIKILSIKFPENYKSMLLFLIEILKDEGGFEFKIATVEALFDLIYFIPKSRDLALENLCEFIEDCEFTELSVRILNLLGNEGPKTSNPTLYIRHIYNRVVLENSIIRSAAVIALTKFALIDDEKINKSIKILLKRIVNDNDDEVRDRAIISIKFLENLDEGKFDKTEIKNLTKPNYVYDLNVLERGLQNYISSIDNLKKPFNIEIIPKISESEFKSIELKKKSALLEKSEESSSSEVGRGSNNESAGASAGSRGEEEDETLKDLTKQQFIQELSTIEEFKSFGELLNSSAIIPLTEKDTEFVVESIKHVFEEHIVIQYNIENTLNDVLLESVSINAIPEDEESLVEEFSISIDQLVPHSKGTVYVSFNKADGLMNNVVSNTLTFTSKECDSKTFEPFDPKGFEDEYSIEDLSIGAGDFIVGSFVGNFTHQFDELSNEMVGTFGLGVDSIEDGVKYLSDLLSMSIIEGQLVTNETSHEIKMFGKSIDGKRVGSIVKFIKNKSGVTIKLIVRSDDAELSECVINSIA